jgi:hypothetical protein
MPDGLVLALLLAGTVMCAAAGAVGGWQGAALALAGISLALLMLAVWTAVEG